MMAANITDLTAVCRLRRESLAALSDAGRRDLANRAKDEIDRAAAKNITIITCDDPLYPPLLKKIHDPPVVLYVLGDPLVAQR